MERKISNENSPQKKLKEISFVQKCIMLSNIFQNKTQFVVNQFNNIPYIKLYTASLTGEHFIYSKIRGGLFLVYEENEKSTNFFLQIYDINDYSLAFSLPINQKLLDGAIIEEGFIIIPTRQYFIGFQFSTIEEMKKFILMLKCEKPNTDINLKAKEFECQNTEIIKVIKSVKDNFDKKLKTIDNESNKINKEVNIFQKLNELYCLMNCVEYSDLNNKINIFIDKTINPYIIKSYIDAYRISENKNVLPYKIVFNDYNQIKCKKTYVEILVKNLIKNFEEEKKLIIFKREHKKRHAKEEYIKNSADIRSSAMIPRPKINIDDKNKNKFSIKSNMDVIKEEPQEKTNNKKNSKNKK